MENRRFFLEKVELRRQAEDRDGVWYRNITAEIRKVCTRGKEHWTDNRCEDIEQIDKNKQGLHFENTKDVTNKRKWKTNKAILKKDRTVVLAVEEVRERWSEYKRELFCDDDRWLKMRLMWRMGQRCLSRRWRKWQEATRPETMERLQAAGDQLIIHHRTWSKLVFVIIREMGPSGAKNIGPSASWPKWRWYYEL